jgi:hypothetical protein
MNSIWLLKLIKTSGFITDCKRLQKLVFISKEKYDLPFNYSFALHFFGPYSSELQEDISFLVDIGFLKEKSLKNEMKPCAYELTDEGDRLCEEETLDPFTEQQLAEIVTEVNSLATSELLNISYQLYSSR